MTDERLIDSTSSEYSSYKNMLLRCYDSRCNKYEYYGGRGIKVCDRWRKNFQAFINDMGLKPSREYSIDRIDPDKDYEPTNCRWLLKSLNRPRPVYKKPFMNQKVRHAILTYWGYKKCMACFELKALIYFHNMTTTGKTMSYCKSCSPIVARKNYLKAIDRKKNAF